MNSIFHLLLLFLLVYLMFVRLMEHFVWRPARAYYVNKLKLEGQVRSRFINAGLYVDFCKYLLPVVLYVFLVRGFMYDFYNIPTSSMEPTVKKNEVVFVDKTLFGMSDPVFHHQLFSRATPKRGDLVVFELPENPSVIYLKRVIGLPGDFITYHDKQLTVTSRDNREIYLQNSVILDKKVPTREDNMFKQPGMKQAEWVVPAGHYFVMGDNRDHSQDSRYWGFLPHQNLIGKVFYPK